MERIKVLITTEHLRMQPLMPCFPFLLAVCRATICVVRRHPHQEVPDGEVPPVREEEGGVRCGCLWAPVISRACKCWREFNGGRLVSDELGMGGCQRPVRRSSAKWHEGGLGFNPWLPAATEFDKKMNFYGVVHISHLYGTQSFVCSEGGGHTWPSRLGRRRAEWPDSF